MRTMHESESGDDYRQQFEPFRRDACAVCGAGSGEECRADCDLNGEPNDTRIS